MIRICINLIRLITLENSKTPDINIYDIILLPVKGCVIR